VNRLCEGHTYFGRNMGTRQNIYSGRHFAWLKYFTYKLVPVLAPDYKQHILLSAKLAFFLCLNMPTNKNQVTLLSKLIFLSYYYANKRNYSPLASY
jgi:hypothetical protein